MLTLLYTSWCEVCPELESEGFLKDVVLCQLVTADQACLVEIRDPFAALVRHTTCLLSLLFPISVVRTMGYPGFLFTPLQTSQAKDTWF